MQMLLYVTCDDEQVYLHTLSTPGVWLFTLVSLVAALLPDVVIRQIIFISHPQSYLAHKLRMILNLFMMLLMQGAEETLDNN